MGQWRSLTLSAFHRKAFKAVKLVGQTVRPWRCSGTENESSVAPIELFCECRYTPFKLSKHGKGLYLQGKLKSSQSLGLKYPEGARQVHRAISTGLMWTESFNLENQSKELTNSIGLASQLLEGVRDLSNCIL